MLNKHRVHLTLYGIKNCDSCRHVQKWLKIRNVPFTFHDFRADGVPGKELKKWLATDHGELLVNRRSATWRQLSDAEKQSAETNPLPLLMANPTLIKRPVITDGKSVLDVGFSPAHLEDYI